MRVRPACRLWCLFVLLCILAGCMTSDQETEAVKALLAKRSQALNSKDLDLYLSIVSRNFYSSGKDITRLRREVASVFSRYEQVSYRPDSVDIKLHGATATVSGHYALRVVAAGKETVLNGEEHLSLVKESGGWKITAGL